MSRNITVGIDIGTQLVKVVVADLPKPKDSKTPVVIGTGIAESKGLRHGYIVNMEEVVESIREAVSKAEKASKLKIRNAYISIGGIGLSGIVSTGIAVISRADEIVTELDMRKAEEASEQEIPAGSMVNRKIIHVVPLQYKLDGKIILGRPVGMRGMKFEVKTLFVANAAVNESCTPIKMILSHAGAPFSFRAFLRLRP